jgi:MFS family permease
VTSTGASGPPPPAGGAPTPSPRRIRLHGWHHPAILAVAATALASGFAQFAATAALGDIARAFGKETGVGDSVVAQVGLSGTTLGVGLAIIRLASLGGLPLAALGDRLGRRRVLLGTVAAGLAVTAVAALSPGYWWFVALFALARPLLSATNALDAVVAAEETQTRDRAKAIALVTAGYGIGAGLTALIRGVAGEGLGFRGLFALALVPLAVTPLLARKLEEPDRYQRLRVAADPGTTAVQPRVLGRIRAELRPRLRLLAVLAFAIGFVTGPANTFLFVYAENALGMSRSATAAMFLVAGPVVVVSLLFARLPETRGLELEQTAPE